MIRKEPKKYQFTPEYRLVAEVADSSFEGILGETRNLLKKLG
jgi:transcription-repair coupling factor (superfamily II helicase)